jgi:hypothetical protein
MSIYCHTGLVTLLCNPIKPILIGKHSFNIKMTKGLQHLDNDFANLFKKQLEPKIVKITKDKGSNMNVLRFYAHVDIFSF